jgi:hypothetical protein
MAGLCVLATRHRFSCGSMTDGRSETIGWGRLELIKISPYFPHQSKQNIATAQLAQKLESIA